MNIFFDREVDIKRLEDDTPVDTETYKDYLTDVSCVITPLEDTFGEDLEGSYGKDYLMFTNETRIKEEDKVIDGSDTYLVRGTEVYKFEQFGITSLRIRKI
jgi:hypothetical protein